jgi:hypothetical protein
MLKELTFDEFVDVKAPPCGLQFNGINQFDHGCRKTIEIRLE